MLDSLPLLSPQTTRFVRFDEDLAPAFSPAKFGLWEWNETYFQWPGVELLRVDGREVAPLAPGIFRVRWENRIGLASIEPLDERGRGVEKPLWVEILSSKIPAPREHLAWWRAILGSLFDLSPRLVWSFEGQTRRGFEPSEREIGVLEALEWLELKRESLETLVRASLAHNSVTGLETVAVRAEQVRRLEAETAREWLEAGAYRGVATARFTQRRIASEPFSPERAFGAAFLKRVAQVLTAPIVWPAPLEARVAQAWQFTKLATRLLEGEAANSKDGFSQRIVARNKVGASVLGRSWLEVEASFYGAGNPLWAPFERSARLRDVASLWEFWVFFALVEYFQEALGEIAVLETPTDEKRGLLPAARATFSRGVLEYNLAPFSYSTPLRPDFLWRENGQGGRATVAFDAKFRTNIEDESLSNGSDLHKMHAYRDALGVRAAIALHPGRKNVFFDRQRGPLAHWTLRSILEGGLEGVGVWAIRPL